MPRKSAPAQNGARRQHILNVALDAFLEGGYAATSMSTIAARVGGSKGTLYAYVKTKEELFLACLQAFVATHVRRNFRAIEEGGDPEQVLAEFCRSFLTTILSKKDLALHRLVIAEAERFPAIGRAFYTSGPETGVRRLAAFIGQAMSTGQLREGDPEEAARLLLGLCQSRLYQACLFNVVRRPGPARIKADAEITVATFMAAYRRPQPIV